MAQWLALSPLFEMCVQGKQGTKGEGAGGRFGGAKRYQRNKFGPPWQTHGKLRGGGAAERMSHSRNWRRKGGRVGKSACWDGDERRPGG